MALTAGKTCSNLVDGGGGGGHGGGGDDDHEVCQGGQVGVGGPPVQPPAEEEPGSPSLLLWLHHQPFVSIWYLLPWHHFCIGEESPHVN